MMCKSRRSWDRRWTCLAARLCQRPDLKLKDVQSLAHLLAAFNEPSIGVGRKVFNPLDNGWVHTSLAFKGRTKFGNKVSMIRDSAIERSDLVLQ